MEKIYFNYSLKNIPVLSSTSNKLQLIDKMESVIKRMRWKAHLFLNNNEKNKEEAKRETFGFKLKHHPGQLREVDNFEKDLFNIVASLKFRKLNDSSQEKIKSDILDIKSSPNVLIFADKTSNIYKATSQEYNKLLKDNITKSYKKSMDRLEKAINMEAKNIAKKIQFSDRIQCLARTLAFITMKDHKDNFQLPYRLINPSKRELGKISKSILDNINQHLIKLLYVNQCKNLTSVIERLITSKIKRTVPSLNLILESFTHPSQKQFSTRLYCLRNNITTYPIIYHINIPY